MTSRFEKIAAVLADKYVAAQAVNTDVNTDVNTEQGLIKRAVATGEDPKNLGFNWLSGLGSGVLGFGSSYLSPTASESLFRRPFEVIGEVGKQATDPYAKFVHDLLKQYEHSQGGVQTVKKFLRDFQGPQQVGAGPYRVKLQDALRKLTAGMPEMGDKLDALIREPGQAYWDAVKQEVKMLSDSVPHAEVRGRLAIQRIADTLRGAKTPDEVKNVAKQLRELALTTTKAKGQPASLLYGTPYRGGTHQELLQTSSDILDRRSHTPNTSLNLAKVDDLGRAVGKFTNPTLPKATGTPLKRLGGASVRGGLASIVGGLGIPALLDLLIPTAARPKAQPPKAQPPKAAPKTP
jgi:hypothetical protein